MFRFAVTTAAALVVFFSLLAPAAGSVLPAPFIIDRMIENLNLPKQMQVSQEVRIYPESGNLLSKTFEQKVYYRLPGAFRSEISTQHLERIHVFNQGASVTVADGKLDKQGLPWHLCYKDFFVFVSRRNMVDHFADLGINMHVSSLGRLDKKLVYVIGARYPEERRRQLWIGKETFFPVRWIVTPAKNAGQPPGREIRYSGWRQSENTWYPEKIEFYENGETIQTMAVESIKIDPSLPGGLFDVDDLRSSASGSFGEKSYESEPDGQIRQQLEEFKNIYKSGSE
ncbi:MAG: outer membrane lipoprotein-sorting protein [Desulfobacteraceae bacterium]|nr:outer membrane lipoprotein-sorting protein [Desulfobacteraceae bacterium]MCF8094046.1 outer membrane lipoprotein-sorting protein [Desulfobacteraceae bacterium]